ncbi:MAG: DUF3578 domain-containing protein [Bacteroidales bacterium]|nr:DUF3578 domain-containing protein [Bacteroidales bacterium]
MTIPAIIDREHIDNAIQILQTEDIPRKRLSREYFLVVNGKHLPPKYVISEAFKIATGKELDNSYNAIQAKDYLKKKGYNVIEGKIGLNEAIKQSATKKLSYFAELNKFLVQTKTNALTTSNYLSDFYGLKLKVGFGQGTPARVPWIAFLEPPNTVQNGIYPVYLYFKNKDLLILAYGISETTQPNESWRLSDKKTIREYFEEKDLGIPERYGGSYVYRVYDPKELNEQKVDADLIKLLDYYKNSNIYGPKRPAKEFTYSKLNDAVNNAGLFFNNTLILRFSASLITKPFVILTGLSGSGKTKLAQAFTQWICQDESQYRIIPVGADWTNREPLLGYPNALNPKQYVKPDSGVLDLIIDAGKAENSDKPYFLILDEMNLSQVERYFADFLSAMESKEEIPLYAEGTVENGVPAKLPLPSNLFIIGTVNIDETTNMFSPKVLDRANTIEFRLTKDEITNFLKNIRDLNMNALKNQGSAMATSFLEMARNKSFSTKDVDEINETLVRFFGELKKTGAEFGYRTATEILRLIHHLSVLENALTTKDKVDIAIMQKLLPKLHGSRRKLSPVLATLGKFCIEGDVKIEKDVFEKDDFDFNGGEVLYPLSLEKITRMYKGAVDNGFTSFAEA